MNKDMPAILDWFDKYLTAASDLFHPTNRSPLGIACRRDAGVGGKQAKGVIAPLQHGVGT